MNKKLKNLFYLFAVITIMVFSFYQSPFHAANTQISEVDIPGTITITVYNVDDYTKISKVAFSITDFSGQVIKFNKSSDGSYSYDENGAYQTVESSVDGSFLLYNLPEDNYFITYHSGAGTLSCTSNGTLVSVFDNVNETTEMTFNGVVGNLSVLLEGEDQSIISGAEFYILDNNDEKIYFSESNGIYYETYAWNGDTKLFTNEAGKLFVNNLEPGEYSLIQVSSEKMYNGTFPNNTFTIKKSNTTTITVVNEKEYGNIKIKSIDSVSKEEVSDAEYMILDENNVALFFEKTKDGNYLYTRTNGDTNLVVKEGILNIVGIPVGNYIIKSKTAAPGYHKSNMIETIIQKDTLSNVTIKNNKALGSLKFSLQDLKEKNIPDFEFQLTDKDTLQLLKFIIEEDGSYTYVEPSSITKDLKVTDTVITTDKSVLLNKIPTGFLLIEEIKAPDGYYLDEEIKEVEVLTDETFEFKIKKDKDTIYFQFLNKEKNNLDDVLFDIKDEKGITVFSKESEKTSNYIPKLKQGIYTISITEVPDTYLIPEDTTFEVNEDGIVEKNLIYILENNQFKIDIQSKIKNIKFKITNGEYSFIATTDENGIALFSKIPFGEYDLLLSEVPSEFYKNSNMIEFLTFANEKQTNTILIDQNMKENYTINYSLEEIETNLEKTISEKEKEEAKKSYFFLIPFSLILLFILYTVITISKKKKQSELSKNVPTDNNSSKEDIIHPDNSDY